MTPTILPSLLAADFSQLGIEIRRAEASGADALHLDIMDGHFVPNISFGPDVTAMARQHTKLPLNVHLMLSHPGAYAARFVEAGAHLVLVHVEAEDDVADVLGAIRGAGAASGITLNPGTPPEAAFPFLDQVAQVLCMSVNPGYGGQSFMPEVLPTIRALRHAAQARGLNELSIMVDGGINFETAAACAAAGADALVAGTFLFRADDMASRVRRMRQIATESFSNQTES